MGGRLFNEEDLSFQTSLSWQHQLSQAGSWPLWDGELLSHFSIARASGLKKKPKIPHGRSANCHLKREKERVAKNSEGQDLIRVTGQRQLASSVRDSCPGLCSSATTIGWGRLTQVHPNPRPQRSSLCWRILATGSSCLYKGPVVNLSSLIHSVIQFLLI